MTEQLWAGSTGPEVDTMQQKVTVKSCAWVQCGQSQLRMRWGYHSQQGSRPRTRMRETQWPGWTHQFPARTPLGLRHRWGTLRKLLAGHPRSGTHGEPRHEGNPLLFISVHVRETDFISAITMPGTITYGVHRGRQKTNQFTACFSLYRFAYLGLPAAIRGHL